MFIQSVILWIKTHKAILGLIALVAVIFLCNYAPGTRLSGWDNLQTDLNPLLGVKRAFFSVWEEYQSMGLVAGMAHGADLVRALIIWVGSLILPSSILRYTFQVSMLLVAALGMRKLLTLSRLGNKHPSIPVIGALFYVLHFAVIQMLYLPFEPFTVFFAMLPWEVWAFLKLFESSRRPTKRDYLVFFLVNILATPQAVAQQLFVVYMLLLGCLSLGLIIKTRSFSAVKRALLAAGIIVLINSFWIFPQVYFLKDAGAVVEQAKIDQLSTQDIFYSNKDMGNITSFLRSEGFFYKRVDQNKQPLFLPWMNYRKSLPITVIIFVIAAIWILGLLKPSRHRLPFLLGLLLVGLFLLTNTPPLSVVNEFIRQHIPFINQIFRSPFTKFAIPLAFISTYFFASGVELLLEQIEKRGRPSIALPLLTGLLFVLPLIQAAPVFTGHLFAKEMQATIPDAYFQTMQYFKNVDKNARIALFPEYTFWGWFNTDWGYDGSGFLWYGIEQPMISRTFDVWSLTSESYYWELEQALASEDVKKLQGVLDKYDVDYIVFDHSLNPIVGTSKSIQYASTNNLLAKDVNIREVKIFGNITIYHVTHPGEKTKNFVSLLKNVPNIGPAVEMMSEDTAYETQGDYLTDPSRAYDKYYPFLDVMGQTDLLNKQWYIQESATGWIFSRSLPASLATPLSSTASANLTMSLYEDNTAVHFVLPVQVKTTKNTVQVAFPKVLLSHFEAKEATAENCTETTSIGSVSQQKLQDGLSVTSSGGAVGCMHFDAPFLDQAYGYIVTVTSHNTAGANLFFYALDGTKEQPYVEDKLTGSPMYYVLGPKYDAGLGYSFIFQNQSYTHIPSKNTLQEANVYFIPYDLLKQLTVAKTQTAVRRATSLDQFAAQKVSYDTYHVTVSSDSSNLTLVLGQSYDAGWHAYQTNTFLAKLLPVLFAKELPGHVKVNNWENGWMLPQSANPQHITLVFVPQYFAYLGLVLIPVSLLALLAIHYFRHRKDI